MAIAGRAVGRIALGDPIRPDSEEVVRRFKFMCLQLHLYSGDRESLVQSAACALGISDARGHAARCQARRYRDLARQGRVVGFIGEGDDDAPSLAQADLAVAVAAGRKTTSPALPRVGLNWAG